MKFSAFAIGVVILSVALFLEDSAAMTGKNKKRKGKRRRNKNRNRTTPVPNQPCPPIPHVDHGQGLDTGNTVQYACEPGYVLEGTNVITCLNGRWTVAPRCRRQLCPHPPNTPFANAPSMSNGGVTATYTCHSGYRIRGGNGATSTTVHCSTQTQFWPNLPSCEVIPAVTCGAPHNIQYAQSTLSGNTATYTCLPGYRFRAGSATTITCVHGVWPTTHLPVCEKDPTVNPPSVMCLKSPPCGGANIKREEAADSYTVGNKIKYTCDEGYRIVGPNDNTNTSAHVFCNSDGTWTPAPTCEPVSCGTPAAGVNTVAVVANNVRFGATYTYACIANHESGSTLESVCMADGSWSLTPPPACTMIMCREADLPALANADFLRSDVPIGGTVTYTCFGNYRLAPGTSNIAREQSVMCQANGTFTSLQSTCVYIHPESCRDYFTRDNLFEAATISCTPVIIDPQGPNIADPMNPPEAAVQCCKTDTMNFCTRLSPTAGATLANSGDNCDGTATSLIQGTLFTNPESGVCEDSPQMVSYAQTHSQISAMVSSAGACTQVTTIACTAAAQGFSLALQYSGEARGFMYGTSNFILRGAAAGTSTIQLSHYSQADEKCDCAPTPNVAGAACDGGCTCSTTAPIGGAGGMDTITRVITPARLNYVTGFQWTLHSRQAGVAPAPGAGEVTATVGDISCCERFAAP